MYKLQKHNYLEIIHIIEKKFLIWQRQKYNHNRYLRLIGIENYDFRPGGKAVNYCQ